MYKRALALLIVGAMWIAVASASAPAQLTGADWTAAAQASLAECEHDRQHQIVVLDDTLPPEAQLALKGLRETLIRDQLPEQEKYVLPPGNYLLVRRYQRTGDQIEFSASHGVVERAMGHSCGQGENFVLARAKDGTWGIKGLVEMSMC